MIDGSTGGMKRIGGAGVVEGVRHGDPEKTPKRGRESFLDTVFTVVNTEQELMPQKAPVQAPGCPKASSNPASAMSHPCVSR